MLALLLTSPEYQHSREGLIDKLWSDRAPEQARASLRTTLSDIRKSFGEFGDVLKADVWHVALNADAIEVADQSDEKPRGLFLDGLAIKDPEFENWIRDKRQELDNAEERARKATKLNRAPVLLLALPDSAATHTIFADYLKNAVSKTVADWGIVDVRWEGETTLLDPNVPTYRLETHEQQIGDGIALQAQLTSRSSDSVLWQIAELIPVVHASNARQELAQLINGCVDRTLSAFAGSSNSPVVTQQYTYFEVMQDMLKTQGRAYDRYFKAFEAKFEQDGRGIHLAWQGFLSCWAVGERHRRDLEELRSQARALMRKAIELEPHNSVVFALASHVFGFVLSEYDVAYELAKRSLRLDKNNPLGWAFLGVAELNLGYKANAFEHVTFARSICGDGPHRAFIDSVAVQIGTLTGNAERVFSIGESLCMLRPKYSSPLRHLIVGYIAAGDMRKAEMTAMRLQKNEPDFQLELFREPDYPVHAMRQSGIIDMKRLPKLI